jgi:flagellar hook protein FlgE
VVDLSAAAVALIQSRNNFEANSKVIQVADEMEKTLVGAVG